MAQKLKDDLRQAIIDAAKQEFLEKGYKGASMRSIASKANMTVGNLYRYYKNKEDINLSIVAPTFKQIADAVKSLNQKNVSMEIRMFDLKPNLQDLKANYDSFAEQLVKIYFSNKTEFNILIIHSKVNEEIIKKFNEMITVMISDAFVLKGRNDVVEYLARAYSQSLFYGLQSLFKENIEDATYLQNLIKTYFRSFLDMLDKDLSQYL